MFTYRSLLSLFVPDEITWYSMSDGQAENTIFSILLVIEMRKACKKGENYYQHYVSAAIHRNTDPALHMKLYIEYVDAVMAFTKSGRILDTSKRRAIAKSLVGQNLECFLGEMKKHSRKVKKPPQDI